ncbi:hypothetical protein ElP_62700 [Tautonia plasticadhaerens]|uniref:Bacteriophage T5 Orf172 DNA-binding domain-containing protein n=2 Tax=Tautonia plasticadhaerens TaxID=2527974 RepID=A0A518HBT6_9BACT|nr:hypothetical protein ElP_62700 [Tautonia plasticadhaerens]
MAAGAKESLRVTKAQSAALLEEAESKAKEITREARKEAKEKTRKVEETLALAVDYAAEIRMMADKRAEAIADKAYESLRLHDHYADTVQAYKNTVDGYLGTYAVPASHLLDELADEFGFHKAGERLKLARQRTRIMEESGEAADCNYPPGWKRDYAINFVLSAFNGKVDSILSRVKPSNQGKQIQEIKDVFSLVNHNGNVFKGARIHGEFLESRLDEYKWAVAIQRLKDKQREEQRAIREQVREEEKARKELERALKQARRDEELLSRALEQARLEFEHATIEEKGVYEARLNELSAKLADAEEKNRRAVSMAQQTKCGHVYIISNPGSFGGDVFKIGLTRRLEPMDRVRELGNASVPFGFDVHAMIYSEDAPALEASLHRKFLPMQVNKVNRRKEFFRVGIHAIKAALDEMGLQARWTLTAEAREYKETLTLENAMRDDPQLRSKWLEEQAALEQSAVLGDEEEDDSIIEEEGEVEALP